MTNHDPRNVELAKEKVKASATQDSGCFAVVIAVGVCVAATMILPPAFAQSSSKVWAASFAVMGLAFMGAIAVFALLRFRR